MNQGQGSQTSGLLGILFKAKAKQPQPTNNESPELILDETTKTGLSFGQRNICLKSEKLWHKFEVQNVGDLTRNQVLKAIIQHVHPKPFIPVFYRKENDNTATFLARNCRPAILKLFNDNFKVPNPYQKNGRGAEFPFKISIRLHYSDINQLPVDCHENIIRILEKRFNRVTKHLDLNNFSEDPDLAEYVTFSQPKYMYFVLHIAKSLEPEAICLSNNELRTVDPLNVLVGTKLHHLDLSDNELENFANLKSIRLFDIKELILTGNPLCQYTRADYVSKVQSICSTIQTLDGVTLKAHKGGYKRNWLCDPHSVNWVNEFLETYFTTYDKDRARLLDVYAENAMFSTTCVYLSGQISSGSAVLNVYSNISRNFKKGSVIIQSHEYLYSGRKKILQTFANQLPPSDHDPYSFTTDLFYKTDSCAFLMVTGIYREQANSLLEKDRILGFSRSFAIKFDTEAQRCYITNDMLHIYNALTYQEKSAFTQTKTIPTSVLSTELIPVPQTPEDRSCLIDMYSQLTGLNDDWAKRMLEAHRFDLTTTLETFIKRYKNDDIPHYAFIRQ